MINEQPQQVVHLAATTWSQSCSDGLNLRFFKLRLPLFDYTWQGLKELNGSTPFWWILRCKTRTNLLFADFWFLLVPVGLPETRRRWVSRLVFNLKRFGPSKALLSSFNWISFSFMARESGQHSTAQLYPLNSQVSWKSLTSSHTRHTDSLEKNACQIEDIENLSGTQLAGKTCEMIWSCKHGVAA